MKRLGCKQHTHDQGSLRKYLWRNKYLYLLLIPGILYFIIFNYAPMYGLTIAFKDFKFSEGIFGSPWNGLENFKYLFGLEDFYRVLANSLILSLLKLVFCFPIPIILALMINEIRFRKFKKGDIDTDFICRTLFPGLLLGESSCKSFIAFLGNCE